jgi:hypothetical protein
MNLIAADAEIVFDESRILLSAVDAKPYDAPSYVAATGGAPGA